MIKTWQEPIGHIIVDNANRTYELKQYEAFSELPDGTHEIHTAPQPQVKQEPVAFQERQTLSANKWSDWYPTTWRTPDQRTEMVIAGITYQWRALYLHPQETK